MNIQIKYVDNTGSLKETKGELFQYGIYQFCLSCTNDIYVAHEITTGHLTLHLSASDNFILNTKEARSKMKEKIIECFTKDGDFENRIKNAIIKNDGYGLKYPINNPIKLQIPKNKQKGAIGN